MRRHDNDDGDDRWAVCRQQQVSDDHFSYMFVSCHFSLLLFFLSMLSVRQFSNLHDRGSRVVRGLSKPGNPELCRVYIDQKV